MSNQAIFIPSGGVGIFIFGISINMIQVISIKIKIFLL